MRIKLARNRIKRNSQKGFTLIEILIVVAVIALLAAVSISTFGNYSKSQIFGQAYRNFQNVLNTAKSRSISQEKPSIGACIAAGSVLNGYSVTIYTSGANANKYTLNVVCSNTTNALPNYTLLALPSGVAFSASSLTSVFFPIIKGGAVLNNSGLSSGTITLVSGSATKIITIYGATGRIQ